MQAAATSAILSHFSHSYFPSPLPTELKDPVDPKHQALRRESLPFAPGRCPRRRNSICGSHLSVLCSAEINTTSSGTSPEDASPPQLFDVLSKQTLWLCRLSEPPFAASRTLLPTPLLPQPKARGGLPPFGGHLSSRHRLTGHGSPYVPAVSMECPTNYDNNGFSFGFLGILKTTTTKKGFLMFSKWLELDESVFAELISRQNHFSVLAHSSSPLFARRLKQGRVA